MRRSGRTSRQDKSRRVGMPTPTRVYVCLHLRPVPSLSLSLSLHVMRAHVSMSWIGWKVRLHGQRRGDDRANRSPGSDGGCEGSGHTGSGSQRNDLVSAQYTLPEEASLPAPTRQ
ncbi:hypothetical protein CGRA01v4_03014 [Colletotrichum graminicola]|nr:hypothetical protein CGRA01v4_03014 [Colletotrichum graminicola]